MKPIKAWAVFIRGDEIEWRGGDESLAIYSSFFKARSRAYSSGLYEVVPIEIRILPSKPKSPAKKKPRT